MAKSYPPRAKLTVERLEDRLVPAMVDFYLALDGVQGETRDDVKKEHIEIESFSFGVNRTIQNGPSPSSDLGQYRDLDIGFASKQMEDKALVALFQQLATSNDIPVVELKLHKAGDNQQPYLNFNFDNVFTSKISFSGSNNDSIPQESIRFNFTEFIISDTKGKEQISVHGQFERTETLDKNETITVHLDRTETVDKNETSTVGGNRTETVNKDETITIHVDRTETVNKNETITVGGNRTETVSKDETITIHVDRAETVDKNEKITVSGNRTKTVSFFAFDPAFTGGVFVATGDLNGDGFVDIITGLGPVGGSDSQPTTNPPVDPFVQQLYQDLLKRENSTDSPLPTIPLTVPFSAGLQTVSKALAIPAADSITLKTGVATIVLKKDGTMTIKGNA